MLTSNVDYSKKLSEIDISSYDISSMDMDDIFKLNEPTETKLKLAMEKYNNTQVKQGKPKRSEQELLDFILDKWRNAKLSNDLVFNLFMDDMFICRKILETLLKSEKINIGDIDRIERQKVIDLGYNFKGIRLDIYVKGSDKVFVIEMQTGSATQILERMVYYSSVIISDQIQKGASYKQLQDTYVIFICTDSDPLKRKQCENKLKMCVYNNTTDTWSPVNSKLNWLIFNVSEHQNIIDNEDLKSFFLYLIGNPRDDKFTDIIDKQFKLVKQDYRLELNYMAMSMRDIDKLDEGIALGIDLGEKRGEKRGVKLERKNVINTLLNKDFSVEDIQNIFGYTISEIKEIKDDYLN